MAKPDSQRLKEYLKRLKEKKSWRILGERNKKKAGKADVVESHRQAALQWENTKRPRQKKVTKSDS